MGIEDGARRYSEYLKDLNQLVGLVLRYADLVRVVIRVFKTTHRMQGSCEPLAHYPGNHTNQTTY